MVAEVKMNEKPVVLSTSCATSNVVPINKQTVSCFQGQIHQPQDPTNGLEIEQDYVYMKDPETGKLVKVIVGDTQNIAEAKLVQKPKEVGENKENNKPEEKTVDWDNLTKAEKVKESTSVGAVLGGFIGASGGAGVAMALFAPPVAGVLAGAVVGIGVGAIVGAIGSMIFCDEKKEK